MMKFLRDLYHFCYVFLAKDCVTFDW